MNFTRRKVITVAGAAAVTAALPRRRAWAQGSGPVKIGMSQPQTGSLGQGGKAELVAIRMWVDDVNKKGGLMIKEFGKRIPIEVTEYDDTSNVETMLRLSERLMTQDKVDFVLPPWSTGFNLAAAPVYARNGYPQLTVLRP